MSLAATLIQELEVETATTRRVLERVPDARLNWSPHPKSRSLGQLAWHIATNPGNVMKLAAQNPSDFPTIVDRTPSTSAELLPALDESVATAKSILGGMSDADLTELWRLRSNGHEVMAIPRINFLRAIFLNHWYHHRGQLSVYLRLLDVPVPAIYGPSADENPFG
jgi:uncharacterized damage-inducible protein DinB